MPARRVFAWEPEEQWTSSEEREKKIEELSRELDESMDSNSGKGCLKAYLVKNEVWHIADIDYELRVDYKKYLKSTYSDSVVRSYLRGMDKAKLYAIRKHANTLKGKQEIAKNTDLIQELLFLPYHPNPAIAERYDCKVAIDKLVWDFRVNGSELCKRQLLEIIEDVVLRDIMLRECTMRLNGLKVVYQFCMQEHIEDLRYITQVQADKLEKYADTAYAKELAERELRECQKYLFCHAKNILWDSTVWYLERLHLEQYRVNPSNPVKKFSFMGIEKRENREILQEYMKYCLGVTHLAMSGIQAEFYRILAFAMWMEKETAMELKLASEVKQDLTRTTRIINFKEISQQDLREEVKKAIYFQLKTESIGTVKKEMTAIRRFSRYLKENNKEVDSCSKLDRKIMEEYLIYMKTEDTGTKRYRAELTRLRALLNMVADVYQYPQVKDLILNRDIPPDIRGEIKIYSDQELKRFNAFLTKVDVQTARLMLIHQMLGTRMSDTLTLRTDCLIEKDGETIIQIHQMKTHFYEKPISQELAVLIKEAIRYREKEHGKGKYIFTSLSDPSKPMKYATVQQKITDKIYQENLRDDKGEYFGFGSHMYRHIYGMKLAEMHVDDWTIARLLGHRSLRNVKYYRKMSNKILADDTRKTRNRLSKMVLECLEGWEEEYEQIRFDDSLQ